MEDLLSYTGVLASGMALFLMQQFWKMSNKFAALEAKQNTKIGTLKEVKAEIKEIHGELTSIKLCLERLRNNA